jgi:hypothetical protein
MGMVFPRRPCCTAFLTFPLGAMQRAVSTIDSASITRERASGAVLVKFDIHHFALSKWLYICSPHTASPDHRPIDAFPQPIALHRSTELVSSKRYCLNHGFHDLRVMSYFITSPSFLA